VEEMRFRTQQMLPPFRRMAKLELADPVANRGRKEAEKFAHLLETARRERSLSNTLILGPVPPYFSRVDKRYRWQIIVRAPNPLALLDEVTIPRPWIVDIDPMSTL
jgi:primosomal protein N' (replication factor Y) (superfamily II helicase)